jgi:Family of unknown function (DUF5681)
MSKKQPPNYDVGFERPPRLTQFRKGTSGNPKGRPKGSPNRATLLEAALVEKVMVNENGERRQITKGEAILKQLVNKAAAGDPRSAQMILGEIRAIDARLPVAHDEDDQEDSAQMVMLERLTVAERLELRRLVAKAQGDAQTSDVASPEETPSDSGQSEKHDPHDE